MSDASLPHCDRCGSVQYACVCDVCQCADCGCELDEEAIAAGREMCFECYCRHQD